MVRFASAAEVAKSRWVRRYIVPVALVAIALIVTLQVPDVEIHSFFSVFLAAVAVSAYVGGWQAGSIAAVSSIVASDIFFLRPTWGSLIQSSNQTARLVSSLQIDDRSDLIRLTAFAFTSFVICLLAVLIERKEQALRGAQQYMTLQAQEIEFLKSTAKIWTWEYSLQHRRVTWTNMYSTIAMRREEPVETWLDSIHPDDRGRVMAALDRALVEGEFEAEYRVVVDQAEPRRVMGRAVLYSMGGQIAGLRGIEIDREMRMSSSESQVPSSPV
jgi:K+-sensing histidine kinase KdpD